MDSVLRAEKQRELATLRARIVNLEDELAAGPPMAEDWRSRGYYLMYYVTTGFFLGIAGAVTSLMVNVIGSLVVGQHPLRLMKEYLTFGLGEKALDPALDSGLTLAVGCCLYIATGMLLGVPFHVVLTRFASRGSLASRLVWATGLALVLWLVMYYGLLSWIQPLLYGQAFIVKRVPWHVAALTHLTFGWTMAVVYPWGLFEPYRVRTENA